MNELNMFWYVFIFISVFGIFCVYIFFYRTILIKRKVKVLFGENVVENRELINSKKTPYMKNDSGSVIFSVEMQGECILLYEFVVNQQINMIRFIVHSQRISGVEDGIYSGSHIRRLCKAKGVYKKYGEISEITEKIKLFDSKVEAVEVFSGLAFVYYRLNNFFGYGPVFSMSKHFH